MRINSCPVPYLYLSFSVISSDRPPSFLTLPPSLSALLPPTLHSLLPPLYCTCLSNASVISGVLFILHPHPNCLSLSCLSLFFFFFFYACLLLTEVYHSRGGSQSWRSHFIIWKSAGVAWHGRGLQPHCLMHTHSHSCTHRGRHAKSTR